MIKKLLTREQMEKLTTRNLLAYLRSLHKKYNEGPDWDECGGYIPCHKITKGSPEWQEAYNIAKEILSKREHIPRKNDA